MKMKDFLELINYGNIAWKGFFSLQEKREILHTYYAEYKHSKFCRKLTYTMRELIKVLTEDGSDECMVWKNKILSIEGGNSYEV